MHGNLDSHPDFQEILKNLEVAARAHTRNETYAGLLILFGTGCITAGVTLAKLERIRQKYAK